MGEHAQPCLGELEDPVAGCGIAGGETIEAVRKVAGQRVVGIHAANPDVGAEEGPIPRSSVYNVRHGRSDGSGRTAG